IEREALEAGYAVLLCNTDRREDKRRQYVALLQEMRIAAAIFAGDWVTAHELEVFREAGIPVATIGNRDVRGDVTVEVNNYGATRRLTEHLIAAGHRRIGFIGGPGSPT